MKIKLDVIEIVAVAEYDDELLDDVLEKEEWIENEQEEAESSSDAATDQQSRNVRGRIKFITPRLVSVLDNCKVSDRYAAHILAAVAEALGHPIRDLVINRESIRQCRDTYREELSQQIKEDFHANVN